MLAALAATTLPVVAQEGTPGEEALVAHHPAHLHQGTCGQMDQQPAYTLNELAMSLSSMEQAPAIPVMASVTTVEASLTDLLAHPYALDVHEAREIALADQGPLACGDLGGQVLGDTLAFGLREQQGSGLSGVAVVKAAGNQTMITLYLAHGLSGNDRQAAGHEGQAVVTFHVPTITCGGCALRVEASLAHVPGILDVQITGQEVTVTYDPGQISPDQIRAAIESGGDTAEPVAG
jgi:copper chaperone CopZ